MEPPSLEFTKIAGDVSSPRGFMDKAKVFQTKIGAQLLGTRQVPQRGPAPTLLPKDIEHSTGSAFACALKTPAMIRRFTNLNGKFPGESAGIRSDFL